GGAGIERRDGGGDGAGGGGRDFAREYFNFAAVAGQQQPGGEHRAISFFSRELRGRNGGGAVRRGEWRVRGAAADGGDPRAVGRPGGATPAGKARVRVRGIPAVETLLRRAGGDFVLCADRCAGPGQEAAVIAIAGAGGRAGRGGVPQHGAGEPGDGARRGDGLSAANGVEDRGEHGGGVRVEQGAGARGASAGGDFGAIQSRAGIAAGGGRDAVARGAGIAGREGRGGVELLPGRARPVHAAGGFVRDGRFEHGRFAAGGSAVRAGPTQRIVY